MKRPMRVLNPGRVIMELHPIMGSQNIPEHMRMTASAVKMKPSKPGITSKSCTAEIEHLEASQSRESTDVTCKHSTKHIWVTASAVKAKPPQPEPWNYPGDSCNYTGPGT